MSEADPSKEDARSLDSYEKRTKAFVIRVWVEPREIESESVVWRGVVESVTGQSVVDEHQEGLRSRRAFTRLDEMVDFMVGHLKVIGIPEEGLRSTSWTRNAGTEKDPG